MKIIEIVPGQSIGDVKVGARVSELPSGIDSSAPGGEIDGVHFTIVDGTVGDVWIDDLRTFKHQVRLNGQSINPQAPLAELLKKFGPCEPVPGIKGGTFFNCHAGVTVGSDPSGHGEFVQIRLKRR